LLPVSSGITEYVGSGGMKASFAAIWPGHGGQQNRRHRSRKDKLLITNSQMKLIVKFTRISIKTNYHNFHCWKSSQMTNVVWVFSTENSWKNTTTWYWKTYKWCM